MFDLPIEIMCELCGQRRDIPDHFNPDNEDRDVLYADHIGWYTYAVTISGLEHWEYVHYCRRSFCETQAIIHETNQLDNSNFI